MKYTYFVGRYIVSGRVPLDPSYTADAALPPQWTSIDTEHTYRFGKGRARAGFRELTLVYVAAFNGASAVIFQHGPRDSQDGEQSYRNGPMAARANGLEAGNGSFSFTVGDWILLVANKTE